MVIQLTKDMRMARRNELTTAIDKLAGKRVQELRLAMGLSRMQLACAIDVTHQQLQKYEKGSNRISLGRLALIAKTLKKPVSYFFEDEDVNIPDEHRRMCIEVSRNFLKIESLANQEAVNHLVRTLANEDK